MTVETLFAEVTNGGIGRDEGGISAVLHLTAPLRHLLVWFMRTNLAGYFIPGAFLVATLPLNAAPVVLDDFSYTAPTSAAATFFLGSMMGGEMDLFSSNLDLVETVSVADGALRLAASGDPDSPFVLGTLYVAYDGVDGSTASNSGLTTDITGGGTNDRIRFDITSVIESVTIRVTLRGPDGNSYSSNVYFNQPGVYDKRFEEFDLDLNDVDFDLVDVRQVDLSISVYPAVSFAINSITFTSEADTGTPTSNAAVSAALQQQLKSAQKALKNFVKRGQTSKVKRFKRLIKSLKSRLLALR